MGVGGEGRIGNLGSGDANYYVESGLTTRSYYVEPYSISCGMNGKEYKEECLSSINESIGCIAEITTTL